MKLKGAYSLSKAKSRNFGTFRIKFLKTWANTPVSIVHESMPSNTKAPHMVHKRTDEFVYILNGRAAIYLDNKVRAAKKGDYLLIPNGTSHSFVTGSKRMEALSIFSPPMSLTKPDTQVAFRNKSHKTRTKK